MRTLQHGSSQGEKLNVKQHLGAEQSFKKAVLLKETS